ncbi:hypothetical protein H6P81_009155 [Aristolochia fimbriata]|uniref:Uncharacterized protein n=1 Tax=Aristolochia fimbriata TaxID=158543 RepID=A0AAV7EK09_ARIFI|nr:hypothetical protein H6P81_009155 [Aristolochia fimbriata]
MELYSRTTIWGLREDDSSCMGTLQHSSHVPLSTTLQKLFESNVAICSSPPRLSSARLSSASAVSSVVAPPSCPDSPWALSPLRANIAVADPSPSLLYHHCIASLHRMEGLIYSVAVSGGLFFTGSSSRRIRVWRHPEFVEGGHIKSSCGHVRVVLAVDDSMLFTAHKDHKIRVWTVTPSSSASSNRLILRSKKQATLPRRGRSHVLGGFFFHTTSQKQQHRDVISALAYHRAEGLLYSASWDRTVKTWKVAEGRCVDTFVAHDERINAIVVNEAEGLVFTASSDASIKIWRRRRRMCSGEGEGEAESEFAHSLTMVLRFQPSPVNALALTTTTTATTNNCFLYSASSDGLINFWCKDSSYSSVSGRYHHRGFLRGHRLGVLCLTTLNDRLVFSGSEDTTIRVWSREEGSSFHVCLAVLEGHRGPVKCLAACIEIAEQEEEEAALQFVSTNRDDVVVVSFLVYSVGLDRMVKVWRIKEVLPAAVGNRKVMQGREEGDDHQVPAENSTTDLLRRRLTPLGYDMSPVLSPSWMERKLQDVH